MNDIVDELRQAIRDRADSLDAGVLAPPDVMAMSPLEYQAAWGQVLADSELLAMHQPSATYPSCTADTEPYPCRTIRELLQRYHR